MRTHLAAALILAAATLPTVAAAQGVRCTLPCQNAGVGCTGPFGPPLDDLGRVLVWGKPIAGTRMKLLHFEDARGRECQPFSYTLREQGTWMIWVTTQDILGNPSCRSDTAIVTGATVSALDPPVGPPRLEVSPVPARDRARVSWTQDTAGETSLQLVDVTGRRLAEFDRQFRQAGNHALDVRFPAHTGLAWIVLRVNGRTALWKRTVILR